jgi:hypothetical protein
MRADPADPEFSNLAVSASALHSPNSPIARFGLADAETLMRRPGSRLSTISMGQHVFRGSWVQKQHIDGSVRLHFEVEEDGLMGGRSSAPNGPGGSPVLGSPFIGQDSLLTIRNYSVPCSLHCGK